MVSNILLTFAWEVGMPATQFSVVKPIACTSTNHCGIDRLSILFSDDSGNVKSYQYPENPIYKREKSTEAQIWYSDEKSKTLMKMYN